jgi:rhomboid protease GluP
MKTSREQQTSTCETLDRMELNHIFLFTAVASSLLVLIRTWRMPHAVLRSSAWIVLAISLLAWLVVRPLAGIIAGFAWLALLIAPALARQRPARPGVRRTLQFAQAPAVFVIIALNIAAFALEIAKGGPTNPLTLHRLGELDTELVQFAHQYWRLFTALFLHYGFIHLLFNMIALYLLGPALEREVGALAFTACYLLAGLGSSAAVVLLTVWHFAPHMQLVGASGCVMGVVGALAGLLLRDRHVPLARARLGNIGVIIALQIAFDLSTPQVSMSAHLGGLLTGFLLGLVLPRQRIRGM